MKKRLVGTWAVATLSLFACGRDHAEGGQVAAPGVVRVGLSTPSGALIDRVDFVLTRPGRYRKTGSFSVAGSGSMFTHTLPEIAAATGYELALSASTSDTRTCRGRSAVFAVTRGQRVDVAVVLSCAGRGTTGSITLNGTFNECPVVDYAIATPMTVAVGRSIALAGSGADADSGPEALSYRWGTASGIGYFSNATTEEALFHCTSPGTAEIVLSAFDGDPQCTGNMLAVSVTCMSAGGNGGAGAGGAGGNGGSDACVACTLSSSPVCRQRYMDCGSVPGEVNGTPKSQICHSIVDCIRVTGCAVDSLTDSPADCLCGRDVDFEVCSTQTLDQLTGECKDIIALGAESTSVMDISTRMGDPAYALGLAMRLIQCDQRFCQDVCPF